MLQGTTDSAGHRFLLPELDVLQPVSVMLIAPSEKEDLTLRLYKDNFDKPLREASTRNQGNARFQIRTQGELRMMVTSNEGMKDYQLIIWVGDEVKIPVPSLYVPIANFAATTGAAPSQTSSGGPPSGQINSGGSSIAIWIIAGSLLVIVALLAMIAMRRRSSQKTAVLFLVVALSALAPLKVWGQAPQQIGPSGVWSSGWSNSPTGMLASTAFGPHWWALPASVDAFLQFYKALTAVDDGYWPEYTPPGMPGIPTACATPIPPGVAKGINEVTWTGPCGECYKDAHEEIAKVLQRFEKLRRVHARTVEVYNTSITFGNGVAMVGGIITTSEWMKIRNGINENYARYHGVYDDKVVELTEALKASLQKVAACEVKYFNNPSWYERYGFMFVTPVVERHRR
ncbi:MAG: hypothetical protein ABI681_08130 [Gemmatimonadales bacterium]